MKQTFEIKTHIDKDIKKGDLVYLIDGSGLSTYETEGQELFIVRSYPKLTNSNSLLKELLFKVIETDVKTNVCMGVLGCVRIQDIIIEINKTKFRTCSQFVKKV